MNRRHHQRQAAAFSLVEVALALGIAAFCLVAVFGLLPVGINNNHASIEQSAAAGIGAALAADMRNTALPPPVPSPMPDQTTPYYGLTIPANPAGTISTAATHFIYLRQDGSRAGAQDQALDPTQNPRYRATIYYTSTAASGGSAPKNAVQARMLITWPPQVSPTSGAAAGAFETITTVPRN